MREVLSENFDVRVDGRRLLGCCHSPSALHGGPTMHDPCHPSGYHLDLESELTLPWNSATLPRAARSDCPDRSDRPTPAVVAGMAVDGRPDREDDADGNHRGRS